MNMNAGYAIRDTRITQAGVMRCCLETVTGEYATEDIRVALGMKSMCRHCGQAFTLSAGKKHPTWLPDWQLLPPNPSDEPHGRESTL